MTDRTPDDATPILPAPSFDSEDLTAAVRVFQEVAATFPSPNEVDRLIMEAAINITLTRVTAMLAANGYPVED